MHAAIAPPFSAAWTGFLESAREVRSELEGWEQLLEQHFSELEFFRAELERQAEIADETQLRLAERQQQLEDERAATARLTHQLDQQDARLGDTLAELRRLTDELRAERDAGRAREIELRAEHARQVSAWQAERDELRAQLAAAANLPAVAAAPAVDPELARQFAELQEERAVLEAELTLMRSRAADLQEQSTEQKRLLAAQHDGLAAELQQLRHALAERPWESAAAVNPPPTVCPPPPVSAAPDVAMTQLPPPLPPPAVTQTVERPADPLVDSVMAQFARLQKDVAQRRKKK